MRSPAEAVHLNYTIYLFIYINASMLQRSNIYELLARYIFTLNIFHILTCPDRIRTADLAHGLERILNDRSTN